MKVHINDVFRVTDDFSLKGVDFEEGEVVEVVDIIRGNSIVLGKDDEEVVVDIKDLEKLVHDGYLELEG